MSYKLSDLAQLDIDDIYNFSLEKFGMDRTIIYMMQMEEMFEVIVNHQQSGTSRKHIANEVYGFPYKSHMIFYRIIAINEIVILRILHGSWDIPNRFKE